MTSGIVRAVGHETLIRVLRQRTWAGWIDAAILSVLFVVMSVASGRGHVGHWTTYEYGIVNQHYGADITMPFGWILLWLAIALLYYSVDEVLTGQTIGKRIMGLKVITISGLPLDGRAVVLRTLGRIIDVLPAFYLVGWIMMRGPHRPPQRFGDRIARTTVVPVSHPS